MRQTGGLIQQDKQTDEYLRRKSCEGVTLNAATILLKQRPARSSVFEELIHTTQYRNGRNDGAQESRLLNEIEAQKKLIRHQKAYGINDAETAQTKIALREYERMLEAMRGKGGNP